MVPGGEIHSQTIAINRSSDCVECTDVGGLDAFKHCNVPAVDVFEEACRKWAPVIDGNVYLSCFEFSPPGSQVDTHSSRSEGNHWDRDFRLVRLRNGQMVNTIVGGSR